MSVRYRFDDIERLLRVRHDIDPAGGTSAVARVLGVTHGQVIQWRTDGLSVATADRLAIQSGTHPSNIWPSWFADSLRSECPTCGEPLPLSGKSYLCRRHYDTVYSWEKGRNARLRRALWTRLDRYRDAYHTNAGNLPIPGAGNNKQDPLPIPSPATPPLVDDEREVA